MKWIDSRLKDPPSNAFNRYLVRFHCPSVPEIVFLGIAGWMPKDGYKSGNWLKIEHMNGNVSNDAKVLFWAPHSEYWKKE